LKLLGIELGGILVELVDHHPHHVPPREPALHSADVLLETVHHDNLERLLAHFDAAREPVRVEQLEECREAVRVAVVWCRREEEAVLEAAGEVANRAGELRLDPIAAAARRRGVLRLVDNEETARQQRAQPLTQRVGVGGSIRKLCETL
jgi:hypothetical protein